MASGQGPSAMAALFMELQSNIEDINDCVANLNEIQAHDESMIQMEAERSSYMAKALSKQKHEDEELAAKYIQEDTTLEVQRVVEDEAIAARRKAEADAIRLHRDENNKAFHELMDSEMTKLEVDIADKLAGGHLNLEKLLAKRKILNEEIDLEMTRPLSYPTVPIRKRGELQAGYTSAGEQRPEVFRGHNDNGKNKNFSEVTKPASATCEGAVDHEPVREIVPDESKDIPYTVEIAGTPIGAQTEKESYDVMPATMEESQSAKMLADSATVHAGEVVEHIERQDSLEKEDSIPDGLETTESALRGGDVDKTDAQDVITQEPELSERIVKTPVREPSLLDEFQARPETPNDLHLEHEVLRNVSPPKSVQAFAQSSLSPDQEEAIESLPLVPQSAAVVANPIEFSNEPLTPIKSPKTPLITQKIAPVPAPALAHAKTRFGLLNSFFGRKSAEPVTAEPIPEPTSEPSHVKELVQEQEPSRSLTNPPIVDEQESAIVEEFEAKNLDNTESSNESVKYLEAAITSDDFIIKDLDHVGETPTGKTVGDGDINDSFLTQDTKTINDAEARRTLSGSSGRSHGEDEPNADEIADKDLDEQDPQDLIIGNIHLQLGTNPAGVRSSQAEENVENLAIIREDTEPAVVEVVVDDSEADSPAGSKLSDAALNMERPPEEFVVKNLDVQDSNVPSGSSPSLEQANDNFTREISETNFVIKNFDSIPTTEKSNLLEGSYIDRTDIIKTHLDSELDYDGSASMQSNEPLPAQERAVSQHDENSEEEEDELAYIRTRCEQAGLESLEGKTLPETLDVPLQETDSNRNSVSFHDQALEIGLNAAEPPINDSAVQPFANEAIMMKDLDEDSSTEPSLIRDLDTESHPYDVVVKKELDATYNAEESADKDSEKRPVSESTPRDLDIQPGDGWSTKDNDAQSNTAGDSQDSSALDNVTGSFENPESPAIEHDVALQSQIFVDMAIDEHLITEAHNDSVDVGKLAEQVLLADMTRGEVVSSLEHNPTNSEGASERSTEVLTDDRDTNEPLPVIVSACTHETATELELNSTDAMCSGKSNDPTYEEKPTNSNPEEDERLAIPDGPLGKISETMDMPSWNKEMPPKDLDQVTSLQKGEEDGSLAAIEDSDSPVTHGMLDTHSQVSGANANRSPADSTSEEPWIKNSSAELINGTDSIRRTSFNDEQSEHINIEKPGNAFHDMSRSSPFVLKHEDFPISSPDARSMSDQALPAKNLDLVAYEIPRQEALTTDLDSISTIPEITDSNALEVCPNPNNYGRDDNDLICEDHPLAYATETAVPRDKKDLSGQYDSAKHDPMHSATIRNVDAESSASVASFVAHELEYTGMIDDAKMMHESTNGSDGVEETGPQSVNIPEARDGSTDSIGSQEAESTFSVTESKDLVSANPKAVKGADEALNKASADGPESNASEPDLDRLYTASERDTPSLDEDGLQRKSKSDEAPQDPDHTLEQMSSDSQSMGVDENSIEPTTDIHPTYIERETPETDGSGEEFLGKAQDDHLLVGSEEDDICDCTRKPDFQLHDAGTVDPETTVDVSSPPSAAEPSIRAEDPDSLGSEEDHLPMEVDAVSHADEINRQVESGFGYTMMIIPDATEIVPGEPFQSSKTGLVHHGEDLESGSTKQQHRVCLDDMANIDADVSGKLENASKATSSAGVLTQVVGLIPEPAGGDEWQTSLGPASLEEDLGSILSNYVETGPVHIQPAHAIPGTMTVKEAVVAANLERKLDVEVTNQDLSSDLIEDYVAQAQFDRSNTEQYMEGSDGSLELMTSKIGSELTYEAQAEELDEQSHMVVEDSDKREQFFQEEETGGPVTEIVEDKSQNGHPLSRELPGNPLDHEKDTRIDTLTEGPDTEHLLNESADNDRSQETSGSVEHPLSDESTVVDEHSSPEDTTSEHDGHYHPEDRSASDIELSHVANEMISDDIDQPSATPLISSDGTTDATVVDQVPQEFIIKDLDAEQLAISLTSSPTFEEILHTGGQSNPDSDEEGRILPVPESVQLSSQPQDHQDHKTNKLDLEAQDNSLEDLSTRSDSGVDPEHTQQESGNGEETLSAQNSSGKLEATAREPNLDEEVETQLSRVKTPEFKLLQPEHQVARKTHEQPENRPSDDEAIPNPTVKSFHQATNAELENGPTAPYKLAEHEQADAELSVNEPDEDISGDSELFKIPDHQNLAGNEISSNALPPNTRSRDEILEQPLVELSLLEDRQLSHDRMRPLSVDNHHQNDLEIRHIESDATDEISTGKDNDTDMEDVAQAASKQFFHDSFDSDAERQEPLMNVRGSEIRNGSDLSAPILENDMQLSTCTRNSDPATSLVSTQLQMTPSDEFSHQDTTQEGGQMEDMSSRSAEVAFENFATSAPPSEHLSNSTHDHAKTQSTEVHYAPHIPAEEDQAPDSSTFSTSTAHDEQVKTFEINDHESTNREFSSRTSRQGEDFSFTDTPGASLSASSYDDDEMRHEFLRHDEGSPLDQVATEVVIRSPIYEGTSDFNQPSPGTAGVLLPTKPNAEKHADYVEADEALYLASLGIGSPFEETSRENSDIVQQELDTITPKVLPHFREDTSLDQKEATDFTLNPISMHPAVKHDPRLALEEQDLREETSQYEADNDFHDSQIDEHIEDVEGAGKTFTHAESASPQDDRTEAAHDDEQQPRTPPRSQAQIDLDEYQNFLKNSQELIELEKLSGSPSSVKGRSGTSFVEHNTGEDQNFLAKDPDSTYRARSVSRPDSISSFDSIDRRTSVSSTTGSMSSRANRRSLFGSIASLATAARAKVVGASGSQEIETPQEVEEQEYEDTTPRVSTFRRERDSRDASPKPEPKKPGYFTHNRWNSGYDYVNNYDHIMAMQNQTNAERGNSDISSNPNNASGALDLELEPSTPRHEREYEAAIHKMSSFEFLGTGQVVSAKGVAEGLQADTDSILDAYHNPPENDEPSSMTSQASISSTPPNPGSPIEDYNSSSPVPRIQASLSSRPLGDDFDSCTLEKYSTLSVKPPHLPMVSKISIAERRSVFEANAAASSARPSQLIRTPKPLGHRYSVSSQMLSEGAVDEEQPLYLRGADV